MENANMAPSPVAVWWLIGVLLCVSPATSIIFRKFYSDHYAPPQCVARSSGRRGLCMFAIDCIRARGRHLSLCVDRMFVKSCCSLSGPGHPIYNPVYTVVTRPPAIRLNTVLPLSHQKPQQTTSTTTVVPPTTPLQNDTQDLIQVISSTIQEVSHEQNQSSSPVDFNFSKYITYSPIIPVENSNVSQFVDFMNVSDWVAVVDTDVAAIPGGEENINNIFDNFTTASSIKLPNETLTPSVHVLSSDFTTTQVMLGFNASSANLSSGISGNLPREPTIASVSLKETTVTLIQPVVLRLNVTMDNVSAVSSTALPSTVATSSFTHHAQTITGTSFVEKDIPSSFVQLPSGAMNSSEKPIRTPPMEDIWSITSEDFKNFTVVSTETMLQPVVDPDTTFNFEELWHTSSAFSNFSSTTEYPKDIFLSNFSTFDNITKGIAVDTSTRIPLETVTKATTITSESTVEASIKLKDGHHHLVCGRKFLQDIPSARVVGGKEVKLGSWPWQVSLRRKKKTAFIHSCGATLLSNLWVVTAAHCVQHKSSEDLIVRLGEHDQSRDDEVLGHKDINVTSIITHPHYDDRTFKNDIALLQMEVPITFQANIIPACLPTEDRDHVNETAIVTGWGQLFTYGPYPNTLHEVEIPIITNQECEDMFRRSIYLSWTISDSTICAASPNGGKDSCEGDSGGPMVTQRRDGRWELTGIISWGVDCAQPEKPGVYTRVAKFTDWISTVISEPETTVSKPKPG